MKIKQLIILSFCLCGLAACEDIYKGGENHQQTEVAVCSSHLSLLMTKMKSKSGKKVKR